MRKKCIFAVEKLTAMQPRKEYIKSSFTASSRGCKNVLCWCFSSFSLQNNECLNDVRYSVSLGVIDQFVDGFTSSGKERDEETGYSHFGARYYDADILTGWLSVDPMADKYLGFSSYAYCAWNPVKLVDPDGKEMVEPPIKFKNIGPVIAKSDFIGWGHPGVKENCLDYAKKQLSKAGFYVGGGGDPTNIYTYNENDGVNETGFNKAVDYIQSCLEKGIPVLVGVDDNPGSPNLDKTTDHFIVIVGMGYDEEKGNYFTAYDNATGDQEKGTSDENRLYVDYENKKIQCQNSFPNNYASDPSLRPYTVTQVRKSKKK